MSRDAREEHVEQHDGGIVDKMSSLYSKKCPECLSEIPIVVRRCSFCTQPMDEAGAAR